MIAKTYISTNLKSLDVLYQGSASVKHGLFYSKLAIIELCGWIETTMDDVITRCANRNLRNPANRNHIQTTTIRRNYGFKYEDNFRRMLIQVIGLKYVERVERRADYAKFQKMIAALSLLTTSRNSVAHTYIKGATMTLDAPSVTSARFTEVYDGLLELERAMAALGI
jgi:hypothetical protein